MLLALIILICWPLAELYVAIKVADAVGLLLMIILLFASWPIGSWVLRSRGRAAWRRFARAAQAGRPPGQQAADGALVLVGGLLLIVPGFITDVLGIWLLIAPTRALVRRTLIRNFESRLVRRVVRFSGPPTATAPAYDFEGTAHDIDQPQLRR